MSDLRDAALAPLVWQVLMPPGTHAYWTALLDRQGIAHAELTSVASGDGGASVLFLPPTSARHSPAVRARINALHAAGVPVVTAASNAREMFRIDSRRVAACGIVGSGAPFADCATIRLQADVEAPLGDTQGRVWPGDAGAYLETGSDNSRLIVLALPDARDLTDTRPRLARFDAFGRTSVHEIVSATDHGGLRRFVTNALRTAFHDRGLPWITKSTAPIGYTGMFAFRVDADGYSEQSTRTVADAMRSAALRATWFIDVERHAKRGGAASIRQLLHDGHDVQSHHFHHYTYDSARRNRHNLELARRLLRRWGANPIAAVAPFGTWTPGLHKALVATGTAYSSEFARLHDDLPCAFPGRGDGAAAWQVPIHPICPASLLRAGASEAEVVEYFLGRLAESFARREPAVLYGHPIDDLERCPELFAALSRRMDEHDESSDLRIWRGTMTGLFEFFRQRAAVAVSSTIDAGSVTLRSSSPIGMELEWPSGARRSVQCGPIPRTLAREYRSGSPTEASHAPDPILQPILPPIPAAWTEAGRRSVGRIERQIRFARFAVEARRDLRAMPGRVAAAMRTLTPSRPPR